MYIQLILMTLLIGIHNCQIDFQTICQAGIRQDNTKYDDHHHSSLMTILSF